MSNIFLIFPHQLFADITLLVGKQVYLVEENLFFKQYNFHKQKLVMHRASMQYYFSFLVSKNITVEYIASKDDNATVTSLIKSFKKGTFIEHYDVVDNWLDLRISKACKLCTHKRTVHESLLFINTNTDLEKYFSNKKKYLQAEFYKQQRKQNNLLVDAQQNPIGGKWSYDEANRQKYPKNQHAPIVSMPLENSYYKEAKAYVTQYFNNNLGTINDSFVIPITHQDAVEWLEQFLQKRFIEFGVYEDAIVANEVILNHSVLSPMLNIGLLTPQQIIEHAIKAAERYSIPLNSLEGFIRQLIGWREFIRGVYIYKGTQERTTNYWGFKRQIPKSFYNGTTGIVPLDDTIKKVLATGYCHHIERLMIAGNFMLLCEFHPDAVYQWFMELFIDAYDWVMVPNVYGMSQFADGGLMATKPYISGSSYVLKMSDYKKADWCTTWDALFWHFMNKQRKFFQSNPRLGMLIGTFDKMDRLKQNAHLSLANKFLASISD